MDLTRLTSFVFASSFTTRTAASMLIQLVVPGAFATLPNPRGILCIWCWFWGWESFGHGFDERWDGDVERESDSCKGFIFHTWLSPRIIGSGVYGMDASSTNELQLCDSIRWKVRLEGFTDGVFLARYLDQTQCAAYLSYISVLYKIKLAGLSPYQSSFSNLINI
jgi:hypothetical protein